LYLAEESIFFCMRKIRKSRIFGLGLYMMKAAGGAVAFRVKAEASSSGSSGSSTEDGRRTSSSSTGGTTKTIELTEVDKIMEGVSFSQLCDDFECISSPAVEKTARQLLKDILAIREGNRSLGNFGIFTRYKVCVS
jgi:hypothetical protein